METTKLLVEYLVAGIVILVSFFFAMISIFPDEVILVLMEVTSNQEVWANTTVLAMVFIALAYSLGIVSEYLGERVFEKMFENIKNERMYQYVTEYETMLLQSPILAPYFSKPNDERDSSSLGEYIGKMRFYVMQKSELLYADIAAQISRFRLIRVLFLVESLVIVGLIGQLRYGFSFYWLVMFTVMIAMLRLNYEAIRSRFNRYCRAIERSYLVLAFSRNVEIQRDNSLRRA